MCLNSFAFRPRRLVDHFLGLKQRKRICRCYCTPNTKRVILQSMLGECSLPKLDVKIRPFLVNQLFSTVLSKVDRKNRLTRPVKRIMTTIGRPDATLHFLVLTSPGGRLAMVAASARGIAGAAKNSLNITTSSNI